MSRLIFFVLFLGAVAAIISLRQYRKMDIVNKTFVYDEVKKEYDLKIAEIEKLAHKDDVEASKDEVEKPKVVLDIPLDTAELKAGYEAYHKKGKCITCHGKYGEGKTSQKSPRLAGQHEWYLFKQLVEMNAKIRVNVKMQPYLKLINQEDMKNISAYLSKLPPWPID